MVVVGGVNSDLHISPRTLVYHLGNNTWEVLETRTLDLPGKQALIIFVQWWGRTAEVDTCVQVCMDTVRCLMFLPTLCWCPVATCTHDLVLLSLPPSTRLILPPLLGEESS